MVEISDAVYNLPKLADVYKAQKIEQGLLACAYIANDNLSVYILNRNEFPLRGY